MGICDPSDASQVGEEAAAPLLHWSQFGANTDWTSTPIGGWDDPWGNGSDTGVFSPADG